MMIKRALISVYDKNGLDTFAGELYKRNVELLSTGGTSRFLDRHGIPFTAVETVTGFPGIASGRTLG